MRVRQTFAVVAATVGLIATGAGTSAADENVGQVAGTVWFDRNTDGGINFGEPGRVGLTVTAHNVALGLDFTGVTDDQGAFRIENLPLGTYEVTAPHDGYRAVLWSTWEVTLTDGRPRNVYFPQVGAHVVGRAWDDTNGDGVRQDDEPRRQTTFSAVHNGVLIQEVTSDAQGEYELWDLPSGSYVLRTAAPEGLTATRYRAGEWYNDSDFRGVTELSTAPFSLYEDQYEPNIDVGFVAR
jgi:hypothetical protein